MDIVMDCLTEFTLPTCFVCSAVTRRNDRVCTLCWKHFTHRTTKEIKSPKHFRHPECKPVRVRYLYDWIPDKHPALSNLLIGLKGGASPMTWKKIAAEFVRHHFDQLDVENALIIPIPSRRPHADHAEYWGRSLAELTKLPFENPLRHTTLTSQKLLSVEERKAIQFDLGETFYLGSHIVIVDDIFTTGSTAKAAIEAVMNTVKPPKTIEIWTLAHRQRLAP